MNANIANADTQADTKVKKVSKLRIARQVSCWAPSVCHLSDRWCRPSHPLIRMFRTADLSTRCAITRLTSCTRAGPSRIRFVPLPPKPAGEPTEHSAPLPD
jgi:hypothetical protein